MRGILPAVGDLFRIELKLGRCDDWDGVKRSWELAKWMVVDHAH